MRVMVAMSGGVDSSVAAALLKAEGHEVVGATMKLWGGHSDTGCCSVADVDDARRVAQQLGIAHHVFNFSSEFDRHVVEPYVRDHASGRTPNPCVECNRHLKFERFLDRALQLGFDAVATGHHAQVVAGPGGRWELRRGVDSLKDQSYVLHMLAQRQLARTLFPVGVLTKAEVRETAASLGLRTAAKPDSQDVCFISRNGGREAFLGERIPLRPATVRDREGTAIGELPAVELVTVGQRRGLGSMGTVAGQRRYAVAVDSDLATVTVGTLEDLLVSTLQLSSMCWVDQPAVAGETLEVQMSAHGRPVTGAWSPPGKVELGNAARRVAPGQSVVLYRGDSVVGGGVAA
ncbi:MAG TPA: tRNA 2-thiouridine(34) synthase MnmA [Acidimicrobiales bacterium]|nr:tRNA 2-thiouridine(34) synthase MnmA [Acidimicrobiales bacterium]